MQWRYSRTTDTQWRQKSKKSENLCRCGRQNMLQPYLNIWEWEWIFGCAVKTISSLSVRSPWTKGYFIHTSFSFLVKIRSLKTTFVAVCWVEKPYFSTISWLKRLSKQWLSQSVSRTLSFEVISHDDLTFCLTSSIQFWGGVKAPGKLLSTLSNEWEGDITVGRSDFLFFGCISGVTTLKIEFWLVNGS